MDEITIARIEYINVLNNIKSIIHDLTEPELDELINEVTVLYERFNGYVNMRKHDQPE